MEAGRRSLFWPGDEEGQGYSLSSRKLWGRCRAERQNRGALPLCTEGQVGFKSGFRHPGFKPRLQCASWLLSYSDSVPTDKSNK